MAKVLVAENEPGIALGLEDTLRLEGYQVEVVSTGTRANRRAMEEAFDLILLDVMLPGKSGFDVCRELRQSGFEAPIIFLTARVQEADRISGLDLGANDYVTKPFSPKELMARVRGLLRFVESNRQDRKRLEDEIVAASQVQQRLFKVPAGIFYFDVDKDGKRFLMPVPPAAGASTPPYKIVLNWTSTLKKITHPRQTREVQGFRPAKEKIVMSDT